jgi:hypothetical protein
MEGWKESERDSFHPLMPMDKGFPQLGGGVELIFHFFPFEG